MRGPEPEQEQAPPPERAPQARRPAPAPAPKQKSSDIEVEPKTSKEITTELVAPSPLSPSQIQSLFTPIKEKERSDIAKAKEEKLKAIQEKDKKLDEEASKPFSSKTKEAEFKKHLEDNFRDLDEKTITYLRKQYITTGYLPSPDTFGRTPEEIEKNINRVASGFYTAKGFTT